MIKIHNLTFSYDQKTNILENLSLDLNYNSITGLCGINGVGKSTLLKIILGLEKKYSGEIQIENAENLPLSKLFAYAGPLEEVPFYYTVYDYLVSGRFHFSGFLGRLKSPNHDLIQQVILDFDLQPLAHRFLRQLSSGQQQRVFIARALLQEPRLLILDEPFNHLDLPNIEKIKQILKLKYAQSQIGVLLVTHQLNLLADFAHELIFLKNKTLFRSGKTPDLLHTQIIQQAFDLDFSNNSSNTSFS